MNDFHMTRTTAQTILSAADFDQLVNEVTDFPEHTVLAVRGEELYDQTYYWRVVAAPDDWYNPAYLWSYVSREEWLAS